MKSLFGQAFGSIGPIHFIGIGGIGMSGLATFLHTVGATVQGSDTDLTYAEKLDDAGVTLFTAYHADNIQGAGLIITGSAIKADNPELKAAKASGAKVIHRADLLAEIMSHYATIAVCGTHGKTSTTALIYSALASAGVPVGVINGGILAALDSNVAVPPAAPKGQEQWLVVEADESDASFLKLKPTIAVITNIEPEHMDTYGSEEQLVQSFIKFASSADEAIICGDDPNGIIVSIHATPKNAEIITYGLEDVNDVYAPMHTPHGRGMAFDAVLRGGTLPDVTVGVPGVHSVLNALAALAVAQLLMADLNEAAEGLATYQGVARRFTKVGEVNGADVIDDYGHHPTEIATTLDGAKKIYPGRVLAVIQPHRYTRLRDLMTEFATCAKVADGVLVLPIHAAGENPIEGITHEVLVEKMKELAPTSKPFALQSEDELKTVIGLWKPTKGDAILCFGAGTISAIAKRLGKGL